MSWTRRSRARNRAIQADVAPLSTVLSTLAPHAWTMPQADRPSATATGPAALVPGRYTVVFADGAHRTLEVSPAGVSFASGPLLISFLCGPDNTSDYRAFAHVDHSGRVRLWRRYRSDSALAHAALVLVADPAAAARAYAVESKRCSRCRRPLTRPDSLERGYGERCARGRPPGPMASSPACLPESLRSLASERGRAHPEEGS